MLILDNSGSTANEPLGGSSVENRHFGHPLKTLSAVSADGKAAKEEVAHSDAQLIAKVVHPKLVLNSYHRGDIDTVVVEASRFADIEYRMRGNLHDRGRTAGIKVNVADATDHLLIARGEEDTQTTLIEQDWRWGHRVRLRPGQMTIGHVDDAKLAPLHAYLFTLKKRGALTLATSAS